jgi:hypothetical protein
MGVREFIVELGCHLTAAAILRTDKEDFHAMVSVD